MNKRLKLLTCALVTIFSLSVVVNVPISGPFGVDAVSAATGDEAPVATPSKTPSKTPYKAPTRYGTSSSVSSLLKLNSTGSDVKLVQTSLNNKGYKLTVDGIFGNLTLVAVKSFQSKNGLTADGLVGPATSGKLIPKPVATPITSVTRLLRSGSVGADVKLVQTNLNKEGYKLSVDGIFGKLTVSAVRTYQSKNGLAVDGLVGPATLAKLNPKVVTPPVVVPPVVTPPVVTPPVVTPPVDAVTTASLVDNATAFEKAIGTEEEGGKWIIAILNDVTTDKDLVLQGEFTNTKTPPVSARKIALYAQDDEHVTTDTFTLTAPKLTIKSPDATIQKGTFKGDLYVSAQDFNLKTATIVGDVYVSGTGFNLTKDTKIEGNVIFTNLRAKDSFDMDDTSSVTGTQKLEVAMAVDAVASASLTDNAADFEKAISADGTWIICPLKDMTIDKPLVLEGELLNTHLDPITGLGAVQRKIGLYAHEGKVTNARFTLTAPRLTIKSPEASLQMGTFKGDVYVASRNFVLKDATVEGNVYVHSTEFTLSKNSKIEGNVYFDNLEAQKTFVIEDGSSVTGTQTVLAEQSTVDAVTTASLVDTTAGLETAISKDGTWITAILKDLVATKDLVLEGELLKDGEPSNRKLALYWHDDDRYTTAKYTLQAPTLTIKTPTSIQKGTFVGDLYIAAEDVTLKETQIIGNVYFATQALKDAFELDEKSSISGVQEVKVK